MIEDRDLRELRPCSECGYSECINGHIHVARNEFLLLEVDGNLHMVSYDDYLENCTPEEQDHLFGSEQHVNPIRCDKHMTLPELLELVNKHNRISARHQPLVTNQHVTDFCKMCSDRAYEPTGLFCGKCAGRMVINVNKCPNGTWERYEHA